MNSARSSLFALGLLTSCLSITLAANASSAAEASAADDVQNEIRAVAQAREAAKQGRDGDADAFLREKGKGEFGAKGDSVLLARRAAAVCGWLQNENEYDRAIKLAERTIHQLAKMTERSAEDRAERLYWEAWLEAEVLDRKTKAIALLRQAEKLAPEDERATDLHLQLVAAVAEFGR